MMVVFLVLFLHILACHPTTPHQYIATAPPTTTRGRTDGKDGGGGAYIYKSREGTHIVEGEWEAYRRGSRGTILKVTKHENFDHEFLTP
jgi:hypothetical protein